jgi:hypothetical protein
MMDSKWFKLGALAVVATIAGSVLLGNRVAAQTPAPTAPAQAATPGRGYGMSGGMGMMMQGRMGGQSNSLIAVAAQTLGMTQTDLVAALDGGKTIAAVAEEKDVALDKIVAAFIAPRAQMLQAAVTAGRLTQGQADANLATMKANVTAQLSATFTPRGNGTGTGFVDSDGDGVCDNMSATGQAGTMHNQMNRGGRWSK